MVEEPHAYPELTVQENLEVARRLHPGTPPKAVGRIIERLGLAAYAGRRTATLSHGNAQRLGLAKALIHEPRLLILDEPANGLDPAGIVEIRELLLEMTGRRGGTVFMSSHILAEVARLAGRIGIIHQGRLLQELNTTELESNRKRRLLLRAARCRGGSAGADRCRIAGRNPTRWEHPAQNAASVEHPDEATACLSTPGPRPLICWWKKKTWSSIS